MIMSQVKGVCCSRRRRRRRRRVWYFLWMAMIGYADVMD